MTVGIMRGLRIDEIVVDEGISGSGPLAEDLLAAPLYPVVSRRPRD